MIQTIKKTHIRFFLLFLAVIAALAFLTVCSAKAAVTITMPSAGYEYISWGTGGIEVPVRISSDAWNSRTEKSPRHLWFRYINKGKTIQFFKVDLEGTGIYNGGKIFGTNSENNYNQFGTITLEIQMDIPEYNQGVPVYHVFKESDFAAQQSVTFLVTHDHTGRYTTPPWEDKPSADKPATCTETGTESIHCQYCGVSDPDTVRTIPKLGHKWKITYTWSKDNKTVTAEAVCRHDSSHKVKEKAIVRQVGKKLVATFANEIFKKQEKDAPGLAVPVAKIKLNKTSAELLITAKKKPTLQLKASITPTNATNKDVVWKSSNTKVATVDKKGKVTVLKTGSVTITCTAADGSKVKATCKIVIKNTLVKKITLNKKNATLKQGNILQLKVKSILPKDAVNRNVKWKSSNKKVAVVDKDGRVTARGKGTCVITCTAADGSKIIAKCKITVK